MANTYNPYGSTPYNTSGQLNDQLSALYQTSIQAIILLLIQHQLKDILTPPDYQENSGGQDQHQSDHYHYDDNEATVPVYPQNPSHCPPMMQTETVIPPPATEEPMRDDEFEAILRCIKQLNDLITYQGMNQSVSTYNNYISDSIDERNIIRSIQLNGGRVLEVNEYYFVAQDAQQNRYIIQR